MNGTLKMTAFYRLKLRLNRVDFYHKNKMPVMQKKHHTTVCLYLNRLKSYYKEMW